MADKQVAWNDYSTGLWKKLEDPNPAYDGLRQYADQLYKGHPKGMSEKEFAGAMGQHFFPDYKLTGMEDATKLDAGGTTPPPAGRESTYATSLDRGVSEGAAALDKFGGNVLGLGATAAEAMHIPGAGALRRGETYMHEREQDATKYAQSLPEPSGFGQTMAEAVPSAVGKMIPYAAARTPGGMALTAGINAANESPEGASATDRALHVGRAAGEGYISGKMMPKIERAGSKVLGKVGVPARVAGPVAVGGTATAAGLAMGERPADAIAQGALGAGLSARRKRGPNEEPLSKAKKNVEAGPKTEAPPGVREQEAPAAEQVRKLPMDKLQPAYEQARTQADKIRPSLQRAASGVKQGETHLEELQSKKESLELGGTPPDPKEMHALDKQIEAQEKHIESLKGRESELRTRYHGWQEAFFAARDRARFAKAPWLEEGKKTGEPPSARHELSAGKEPKQLGAGPAKRTPVDEMTSGKVHHMPGQGQTGLPPAHQDFTMLGEQPPANRSRQVEGGPERKQLEAAKPPELPPAPKPTTEPPAPRAGTTPAPVAPKEAAPQKSATQGAAPPQQTAPPAAAKPEFEAGKTYRDEGRGPVEVAPPKIVPPSKLTSGNRYTVTKTNPDMNLYEGDQVVYRGAARGTHSFTIMDEHGGRHAVNVSDKTPLKDILGSLGEAESTTGVKPGKKSKKGQTGAFSLRSTSKADKLAKLLEGPGTERRTQTSIEGEGSWFDPKGKMTDLGAEGRHQDLAMKTTGKKTAQEATSEMLSKGWIRVRADSVEASPENVNSTQFMKAVKQAMQSDRSASGIRVKIGDEQQFVPKDQIQDFLANPMKFMYQNRRRIATAEPPQSREVVAG